MRVDNTLTNQCLLVLWSLDVTNTLSLDRQMEVHRKLVSFITELKPEHDIFAQVSHANLSDLATFLDLGWGSTGDMLLDADDCPKDVVQNLKRCPVEDRTLCGLVRSGAARSRGWPCPSTETWPPSKTAPKSRLVALPVDPRDFCSEYVWPASQIPQFLQSLQPQQPETQPDNQAVSFPLTPPARKATVTLNFLADGTQPFDTSLPHLPVSFTYLCYRDVPIKLQLSFVLEKLRMQNAAMKGVTVIYARQLSKGNAVLVWRRRKTYMEADEAMRLTIANLGWGSRVDPIWLAVKL